MCTCKGKRGETRAKRFKSNWKKFRPICWPLRQNAGDIWEPTNGGWLMGMKNTDHAEHPIQWRDIDAHHSICRDKDKDSDNDKDK